ncbi:MAG: MFS transporter [Planctomycetota bacterium]|jgi:Na+/melibiose symporter-like transporter
MAQPKQPLTQSTKVLYGFGSVAFGVKDNGFSYFLLFFYTQVMGVHPGLAGLALFAALVVDAISDPLVGYISDRWPSAWGRRHPFMYFSALPVAVGFYFLWNPPAGLGAQALFVYLLLLAILVRTLITLYEIPSSALGPELSGDYDQRTSLFGYRFFFGWWGGLTMAALMYGVFLEATPEFPNGQLNPNGYHTYGMVGAIAMCVAILISARGTHSYIPHLRRPEAPKPFDARRIVSELKETLSNRSFLLLFVAGLFMALAAGVSSSLNLYFTTYFWELIPGEIFLIVMLQFVSALIALVVTPRVSRRWDKKRSALGLMLVGIVFGALPIGLRLLELFPGNDSAWLLPILMAHGMIEVAIVISASILLTSMTADLVEDIEITTGRREEGLLLATRSFSGKVVAGAGTFVAGLVLTAIAFPIGAQPGEVDPDTIFSLGLVTFPLIAGLFLISFFFVRGYSVSRHDHERNLQTLTTR